MTLLATKLYIPPARPNIVPRPRLLKLLNSALQRPLTLISAPAGYGKTTLLSAWAVTCEHPVVWVSLDSGDNDPYRFLSYLITALSGMLPHLKTDASLMLRALQPLPPQTIMTTLINDLSELSAPFVVVLDDYQFIESPNVNDVAIYLLDHHPPHMHLVIATRSDPLLPLARLRSRNQLAEIRTDDLRFTPQEAAEFLHHVMELTLTAKDISALETRTEGWIVGLQMAALSLQGRQDSSEFIQSFSGSHRYILEYLIEEVLSRQSEDIRSFLLHTSILERLCGSLCDAVMGRPSSSQEKLERLDKVNLFIFPLDEEHHWYRYHHLFADLLRAQVQKSVGEQGIALLHLRATDWYEQNGVIQEAIIHALIALDFERVERLIEENYLAMMSRGEMTSISFWTGKLPKEFLYSRPKLCIYEAHGRSWLGQLDEADLLLEEAKKHLRAEVATPETQPLLGHLAYVQSRVTAMRGDIRQAIELCLSGRENTPVSNLGLHLAIGITLGYEYFLNGNFTDASKTLYETIRSGSAARDINITVAAYCVLARLRAIQGLLHDANDLFQKAAQLIREEGSRHLGAKAVVEVGIAEVLCEWNNLDAALDHIVRGLASIPLWGKADDFALAYVTLARIYLAQKNRSDAKEAIEKAAQFIQTGGVFSEAHNAVEIAQVKLWLDQEDLPSAGLWASSLERHFASDDCYRFEDELAHIVRARVLIAHNKLDEAISLLSYLEESARSGGRLGRLIEILILKALALQRAGASTQAYMALQESLVRAEPEGYLRIFLDEGESMRLLIQGFRKRIGGPIADAQKEPDARLVAYTEKLSAAFTITNPISPVAVNDLQSPMIESLSQREKDILGLICQGYSNQEIVETLVISMNTVKRHNNNIFRKLEVTNRAQAIVRAHQLGLVKDTSA